MNLITTAATVTEPVRFFPTADNRGKWHAARKVSGVAVCGAAAELDYSSGAWITSTVGALQSTVHPLVCRRCLKTAKTAETL